MDDSHLGLFCTLIFVGLLLGLAVADDNGYTTKMSDEERQDLKEEARDMFYHAYRAYMENAYPADELMPLTCQGRWRGSQPSRGDIDDTLGNFSLTLIDSLDTLVILGDLAEFEHAVKLVIKDVSFDSDIIVSVFETNIRVLGGLLSGHILAEFVQREVGTMMWYSGELLVLAKDIGYRLLPAFNTTTGIPHARVNLRYGMKSPKLESLRETCTACAGTMILEMAALSRLTGEPIFEEKAHKAMDSLWKLRHRSSDLMGTVLNVHSGDWIRRDSGVGAGIDSYYEYCLKAYVLLGHNKYLSRFNKHYSAVMKYISQGPMLLDVHMHRPHTNSRNYMDSLLAFWPGLQVLNGDLKPAMETHEMLYQVMERHTFIPEAFTTDFQVHWGQYPLRPEFLESTYFLYRATGDHYYLNVGKKILKGLQTHARVPCGYAAVNDVRTRQHDDRMDSFVLAETFKYLYLLFADPSDLILDLDKFLFTTEAHLLPLSLASLQSNSSDFFMEIDDYEGSIQKCPSSLKLFPEAVRRPLKNLVHANCPAKGTQQRKLLAANFQSGNPEHQKVISDMGISIAHLKDGRIQLLHKFSKAKSIVDGEEGLLFMQEMLELAKSQNPESLPQAVIFKTADNRKQTLNAGPAHFGRQLHGSDTVSGQVAVAIPLRACSKLVNPSNIKGRIAIVQRGDCMFVEKARRIMEAGAVGGIIVDHTTDSTSASPMFAMSGDGNDDVTIPVVFLFSDDAWKLTQALSVDPSCVITLAHRNYSEDDSVQEMDSSEELPAEIIKKIKKDLEESNSAVSEEKCDLPLRITFAIKGIEQEFGVGRLGFGSQLTGGKQLSAKIEVADPLFACSPLQNADSVKGKIVIAQTGNCKFIEKARHMMKAGAVGGIILEQSIEHLSSLDVAPDGEDDVDIPVVLSHAREYWQLLNTLLLDSATVITLSEKPPVSSDQQTCSSPLEPPVDKHKQSVHNFFHNYNTPSSEVGEVGESGDEVIRISRRPAINPP